MSTITEHYLIVHTDQYTGNIDSFLCGLLFNVDDDRYGWKLGAEQHVPFTYPIEVEEHPDARFDHPYTVSFDNTDDLIFALVSALTEGEKDYFASNYAGKGFEFDGNPITIHGFTYDKVTREAIHEKEKL